MEAKTGVYPCYSNQFQIETGVGEGNVTTMSNIAGLESFSVAFDNGIEEWKPFEAEGWTRRLATARSLTITITGKRTIGDTGNDLIAGMISKNGEDVEKNFVWTFPDGSKVELPKAIINVTNVSAGDSTVVAPLEFDVMSNGKPVFTAAVK